MSWVTVIWSMVASASLTLAAIYCLVWFRNRHAWAHLFFALAAASTTALAFCELWIMRAETPAQFFTALTWGRVSLFVWFVSIIWFVRFHLGAGRLWFAWTITGLRAFSLLGLLLMGQSARFRALTTLPQLQFLGESVTVASGGGVASRLAPLTQFVTLLTLLFVADASVTAWRRGERRKALLTGGSLAFFLVAGLGTAVTVRWVGIQLPATFSLFALGLIAVMGYELSRDVLRASALVHELQVSEAGLRESEARMSLALDAGDFGLWIWDFARNELWASDKGRELFAFAPSERLEFGAILKRLHPDDREGLERVHASAFARSNEGRYQLEYRLVLPDGSIRWIASLGRVETDASGQAIVMRGASREVTARKQAEQEAQRLREEIAHAGRVSMMGQLASGLAHEINQPLASILRNAEAAEIYLQHASPDLDEIRAILADIRTDDERAGHVIDRMRGLLKRHTLDARRLDVGSLVDEVAAVLRVDAARRQVKVEVDVPGDLPQVQGDRVHLQQVLLNLILNGMDALNGARPEDRRVSVAARLDSAETVEIAVGDAGPGIPAERLALIFDPFFTTKPSGMGMGLAISRTIIEAHGGRIWAENKVGGGAAFRFTLPIAEEAGPS